MVRFQVVILIELDWIFLLESGFDSNFKIRIQGEFLRFKIFFVVCVLCFLFTNHFFSYFLFAITTIKKKIHYLFFSLVFFLFTYE
jgi:hypothetical protein